MRKGRVEPERMMNAGLLQILACTSMLALAGCSHNGVRVSTPDLARNDHSYTDLHPGSTVRIVVPLTKSGGLRPDLGADKVQGNTISIAATDLIGYTTSFYAVTGRRGEVQLKFVSAQQTKDGRSVSVAKAAAVLPFELPQKTEYVRLVYLVRASQADHNMAILGSKDRDRLNAYTERLKEDPRICTTTTAIFCSWVPAGVAVRRED